MIRPTGGAPAPLYYLAPPPPPPPPALPGAYQAPLYAAYPASREGQAFRETVMGAGLHIGAAAAIGGAIGFLCGGPVGAAWGAGIGTALGQGFMQLIARMADGGGHNAPLYAAAPTLLSGVAAWAAGAAWGAGPAAWTLIGVPLAIGAAAWAWDAASK